MNPTPLLGLVLACTFAGHALAQQPYRGMETRAITSLSDQQVADLRLGRGMGLALPAELNGWPGPMHVLELADPLGLDASQRALVEAQFAAMRVEAVASGEAVMAAEAALDRVFAAGTPTVASIGAATEAAGRAHAALRAVHLRYHLATAAVLTAAQRAEYARLRGYGGGSEAPRHHPRRHHGG